MEIVKIMDIVNNKNEIVGVIQQEKYSNDLITFVVNTESIGISFNKLAEAINYINKFNYKAVVKDVLANGYKINDIEIVVNDPVKTFKNIYKIGYDKAKVESEVPVDMEKLRSDLKLIKGVGETRLNEIMAVIEIHLNK